MSDTAVMGSDSPRALSPEALSPFPERPIRPLPKRRLRERLPSNVAESIEYPPGPKTTTPLFYNPFGPADDPRATYAAQRAYERERADEVERTYIARRNGGELDSEDDELAYRSRVYPRHMSDSPGRSYRYVPKLDSKYPNPRFPTSATSSVDGYDSFENTNNKKKRKIPTPGDSSVNGLHLSGDMASMGITSSDDIDEAVNSMPGAYPSSISSSSPHGVSGPGRGRYGRIRNGRSPLRTLSDATSNLGNGRLSRQIQSQRSPGEATGIISTAIANAEKLPITPSKGQENRSLLQQQASKKISPASTQFTFTCNSQIPASVPWPSATTTNMHQSPAAMNAMKAMATHATQTKHNLPTNGNSSATAAQGKAAAPLSQKPNPTQNAPAKKVRRRTAAKEYQLAALQRRQQQQYQNYHHPPSREEQWICEFCEYEQIFGAPPEALIRQYEEKDRRLRKQEAERRRLLEKAKMKGRKGKKGNKGTSKAAPPNNDRQTDSSQPTQQSVPMTNSQNQSQGTQNEEYYDDEIDDEYVQDDAPPPSPALPSRLSPRKSNLRIMESKWLA